MIIKIKAVRSIIRDAVRSIVGVKESETIKDALNRRMINISKLFYKKKFGVPELKNAIIKTGVGKGDVLFIHSAWRSFYNFQGKPEDVINILFDIVGEDGTIVMPSYGNDKKFFNVDDSPSCAGVISEVFRKRTDVKRSQCSHFSVAASGKMSDIIIKDHDKSLYGFDEYSPCYKITQMDNAKVLFLGLGKNPSKISIFHCAGWFMQDSDEKLSRLYTASYESKLVYNKQIYIRHMVDRVSGHGNNNRVFRKILNSLKSTERNKVSNLDIVVISANEGFEIAKRYVSKGIYCYKNMSKI